MASIPLFKSGSQAFDLFQTRLKSELDPVLANKLFQGNLVQATLKPGTNIVNHRLARNQIGWMISDQSGPAMIWRSQPLNSSTLTLISSATATITVSLWCF